MVVIAQPLSVETARRLRSQAEQERARGSANCLAVIAVVRRRVQALVISLSAASVLLSSSTSCCSGVSTSLDMFLLSVRFSAEVCSCSWPAGSRLRSGHPFRGVGSRATAAAAVERVTSAGCARCVVWLDPFSPPRVKPSFLLYCFV